MTNTVAVSVILPCRNEAGHLAGCLRSILAQDPPPGGFEVVAADGRSTDGTRAILEDFQTRHPCFRWVDNPRQITPAGLNAAIRGARGDLLVRMDAHTEYAPDYLVQCVKALEESGADNVGGPWIARGHGTVSRAIAAAFQSPFSAGGARGHRADYAGPVDTVYLGCWPRRSFSRFGLFDEAFVRNQDDEHNLRIMRGGGRIWQTPRIRSWYAPRDSLGALFRQYYQYGYWKVRVIRKHRMPASVRHLIPALFVAGLAAGIAGSLLLPWMRPLLTAALGAYALLSLLASARAAASAGWRLFPILPPVFLLFHTGYGAGFLHGLLDAAVRREPRAAALSLTRGP